MTLSLFLSGAVIVLGMAWGLSLLLASRFSPLAIHDAPNARSLHDTPTPRSGGLAILIAIAIGWGMLFLQGYRPDPLPWILAAIVLVGVISFLDDVLTLSALPRFAVHGLAAVLLIWGGLVLPWGTLGIVLSWLAIVWMLNLYNFMDGMDGFSAGMTLCGFAFLALLGWQAGSEAFALYAAVVALAGAGFLLVNFPPARLFMGDIGSIPLGLMAAGFSLWGIRDGLFPLWLPVLVFSPFVVDATVTILRRLLRGEKIWQAHRSHYYQRLVLSGWSHRRTVLAEYFLMIACGLTAVFAAQQTPATQWLLVAIWGIVYIILAVLVRSRETGLKRV